MMIELSAEQRKAYDRYIRIRNRVNSAPYVPHSDVLATVDVEGLNHPLYEPNPLWEEYKEAFLAWLAVEPAFRQQERMRMSRGDYGAQDSWEDRASYINDSYSKFNEE